MPRLTGRKQIMAYLGKSAQSNRAWAKILVEYAPVLYWLDGRHWTTTDRLEAYDLSRSVRREERA